ncbi:MAG TPA: response regulator [Bacteroidetes bacterium]|nr:response regulator [Bacteroidota bacterium]
MQEIHKVCIIDDDPIFVFGLQRFLKIAHLGDEFIHYPNGKLALEGLRGYHEEHNSLPDLILVDLNMPVMDGWQFLEHFGRELNQEGQLVFIISSSIDMADIKRAKKFPFVKEFVYKPVTSEKLKQLVAKYSDPVV